VSNAVLSNAEIADRLTSLAQLLSPKKQNFYRAKAYSQAAARIRNMSENIDELVREGADLTQYAGIGDAIAGAIREIVLTGTLAQLEVLRSQSSPEFSEISKHRLLDPRRVFRIYKKLRISSIESLKRELESGEIERVMGPRMAQHVRQGLAVVSESRRNPY
jgi:DNA polymerase (family X)